MTASQMIVVLLLFALLAPLGWFSTRLRRSVRARHATRTSSPVASPAVVVPQLEPDPEPPTPSAPVPTPRTPARPRVMNPATPAGFAHLTDPESVYSIHAGRLNVFTDSRGIQISICTPDGRAPFLIARDEFTRRLYRSPDIPGYGGWSDWLIALAEIRALGHALRELKIADMRVLDAFAEYGQTRRAIENGAHQ